MRADENEKIETPVDREGGRDEDVRAARPGLDKMVRADRGRSAPVRKG